MRKLLLLCIVLLSIYGCENVNDPSNPNSNEVKEYTVYFGFSGEITNITEQPLSRTSSDDLYGIQVYARSSEDVETPYAYGLFDDVSRISLKLKEGYTYTFHAVMIADGKNKVTSQNGKYGTIFGNIYTEPFAEVATDFIYSNSLYMKLTSGSINLAGVGNVATPQVTRYQAALYDYIPSEEGVVNLNMVRCNYGLKIITEGLTEGRLIIYDGTSSTESAFMMDVQYPETEGEEVFAFPSIYNMYNSLYDKDNLYIEDYSSELLLLFNWEKDNEENIPLASSRVTFKRNKITVIEFKISEETGEAARVNIAIHEIELEEDEDHIIIDSSKD